MSQLPLDPGQTPQTPRRGRPRGSRNKASADLGRWIAAAYGGMTPGQQAAQLCMITSAELRAAKAAIRESGLQGVSPVAVAMGRRAHALSAVLSEGTKAGDGCTPKEAMALLIKAQAELLPYVHQKLPPAAEQKPGARNLVISMPDAHAQPAPSGQLPLLPVPGQTLDDAGLFDGIPEQVGPPKSDETT